MVADVEACADDRVNEALLSALESEVKTQCLVAAAEHSCKRKIHSISCRANKKIDKLQSDQMNRKSMIKEQRTQLQSDQVNHKNMIEEQQSQLQMAMIKYKSKYKSAIKEHQAQLQNAKVKYKRNVREQQRRYAVQIDKHKDEVNSLRELIDGQNDMIEGCVEEYQDKRQKNRQSSKLVAAKKDIAMSRLEKIKLCKTKCAELMAREIEFTEQKIKMKELEVQLLEYELIIEEMTEE